MTLLELLGAAAADKPSPYQGPPESPESYLTRVAQYLQGEGASIDVQRIGQRTTAVIITQADGWETVGLASTTTPWSFNTVKGAAVALEDAVKKMTNGRIYAAPADEAGSGAWGKSVAEELRQA